MYRTVGLISLLRVVLGLLAGVFMFSGVAFPQEDDLSRITESNVIAPQVWTSARSVRSVSHAIIVTHVDARVDIVEQVATTTLVIGLHNPSSVRQEAVLLIPVSAEAVVRSFDFQGSSAEPTAKLLPAAEAVSVYKSIVAKLRDPALLEFAGYGLIRSSVFPVEARGKQAVRVIYEELLPRDDNRIDYLLPRSELLSTSAVSWTITVNVSSAKPISCVYSPSHPVTFTRKGANSGTASTGKTNIPGPFQLSYLLEKGEVSASLLAYPDPKVGGGYFLLLAGLPADSEALSAAGMKREVTLVIDRSGSMQGEKIKQAKAAALHVLEGLSDGESFNIIDFNDNIEQFNTRPVIKDKQTMASARAYIRSLNAGGGTNLHAAVLEAVTQQPTPGFLPIVLLLSDGLPTVGVTNEAVIRDDVAKANVHNRRIFTFGVGYDVNAPLLDNIAQTSRGTMTIVQPNEDVEVKVASMFAKLTGPVFANPMLNAVDEEGNISARAVRDVLPSVLPDMFLGDQLVVLGKYQGDGPLRFRLRGNFLGQEKTFAFQFDLKKATMKNAFVARLWASRKIAVLSDAIRQIGAEIAPAPRIQQAPLQIDPRVKELVDEIVRLSLEFGVLTEYTAFLAREGTDLAARMANNSIAVENFQHSAIGTRHGAHGLSQQANISNQRDLSRVNRFNDFYDSSMNVVQITSVQQIGNRAFFQRGGNWIDSRAVKEEQMPEPDEVVEFGSARFDEILARLIAENNQGILSLGGEAVFEMDGKIVKIVFPKATK